MFYNAGRKIQNIAKVLFWIGAVVNTIAAIFAGVGLGAVWKYTIGRAGGPILAVLVTLGLIGLGILAAWLAVLVLYAFGELCENVMSIEDDTGAIRKKLGCDGLKTVNSTDSGTITTKKFDPDSYPASPVK